MIDNLFPNAFNPNMTANETADTQAQINAIYGDLYYGMSTERNLTIWVNATLEGPGSAAYGILEFHEFILANGTKFRMNSTWLESITDSESNMTAVLEAAAQALIEDKSYTLFNTSADVNDANKMFAQQWAKGDLLNKKEFASMPDNFTAVSSVRQLDMGFMTMPEMVYSGCDVDFTVEDAMGLFDQNLEGVNPLKTLLSPQNYFTFQNLY